MFGLSIWTVTVLSEYLILHVALYQLDFDFFSFGSYMWNFHFLC